MNQTIIIGGEANKWACYDFTGGKITAIFGGVELDLTDCYLSQEHQSFDVNIFCGGVTLILPKEWNVQLETTLILAKIEDEIIHMANTYTDPAARFILTGTIIMGGLEIKRA